MRFPFLGRISSLSHKTGRDCDPSPKMLTGSTGYPEIRSDRRLDAAVMIVEVGRLRHPPSQVAVLL